MAQKDKHQQLPREDQAPSGVARLEAGAGPPPKMKRKEYERVSPRFLQLTPGVEKAMADDGIMLLKYWLEVSPAEQTRRLESRIDDKRRGRLNIISHLLSQVPYKPPAPRDITLPRRQPAHGYVQPDLPLRYIPAPF
jgi:hypothetical protein